MSQEQEAAEAQANNAETSNESQDKKQDNSAEYNFKRLRRKYEQEARERERIAQENELLKQQMQQFAQARQAPQQEAPQGFDMDSDDIPNWGNVKQGIETYAERIKREAREEARKEFESVLAEREKAKIPKRIRKEYPDFDAVVNEDTIEWLNENKPAVANSLKNLASDPYGQQVAVYEYLKAVRPSESQYSQEKEMAAKNAAAPKSGEMFGGQGALHSISSFDTSKEGLRRRQQELLRKAGKA